jgi:hypothetical protein
VTIELTDIARPLVRRVELREQPIGVPRLPDEVVGGHPQLGRGPSREAGRGVRVGEQRKDGVEHALAFDEAGAAEAEILDDPTAEIPARGRAPLMAEHLVHERMKVPRVRRQVVVPVRGERGVAEPAQIGSDHLEPHGGERLDVPGPDPLCLRPSVDEEERIAAFAGAPEGELDAGAHLGPADRELRHGG